MNRRGDLPITILVIGVFAVCTLALFSFVHYSNQVSKTFSGIEVVEEANFQIEANNLGVFPITRSGIKFSPEWGLNWFKEKIIFYLDYII